MNLVSLPVVAPSDSSPTGPIRASRTLSRWSRRAAFTLGLLTALVGWGGTAAPVWADSFTAPDRGYPEDAITQGGGTRSPRATCVSPNSLALAPLVPHSAIALTQAAYPRFFWYFPQTQARRAEFRLLSVVRDGNRLWDDLLIYQTEFQISGDEGIASLQLPSTLNLPPLEVGQPYRWYVSLLCDPNDPTHNITVNGWVERSTLNPSQSQALQQLTGNDRANLFAQEGLWFDTLATLADLQCQNPQRPTSAPAANFWRELLADEDIALDQFSQAPLLTSCPTATEPEPPRPTPPLANLGTP